MKRIFILLVASIGSALAQEIEVLERSMDYRVMRSVREETTERGEVYTATNQYVELGSSMHYWDGKQWLESKAEFRLEPGMAVADTMPHKVRIAANLNAEGAVELETWDGKHFRSTPVLVAFRDTETGEVAGVAKIQDCAGELVAPNRVVFPNALEGLDASIQFTISKFGFEQELVIREPIDSEDYGLKTGPSVRLELWTAFIAAPPLVDAVRGMAGTMEDVSLDFGSLHIGNGKAFTVQSKEFEAPVAKTFGPIANDDRWFLVESISQPDLKPMMDSLRQARAGKAPAKIKRMAKRVEKSPKDLLASMGTIHQTKEVQTDQIHRTSRPSEPAVILDYSTVNGALGNFTFRADTTYYVSADTTFSGAGTSVIFEGGSVIKSTNDVTLTVNSPITWKGDSYRPIVLSAVSDHSVGEKLNTATLSGQYAKAALKIGATTAASDAKLKNFRICNAKVGIILDGRTGHSLDHGQFVGCGYGVVMLNSSSSLLRNCLFNNVTTNLSGSTGTIRAEQITSNLGNHFKSDLGALYLTNSLLVAITTPGTPTSSQNVQTVASATGIFTTVGSGQHYLASNIYRNQGIANVSIGSALTKLTTFPPVVITGGSISVPTILAPQAQRDVDAPDLGYHYPPLDYCIKESSLTSTLLLTNGVAFGVYGESGLTLSSSAAKIISEGKPDQLNRIVRYNSVHEQPAIWGSYILPMTVFAITSSSSPTPEVRMRFTEVSLLGSGATTTEQFLATATSVNAIWVARDCQFSGLNQSFVNNNASVSMGVYLTNNLFYRATFTIRNDNGATGYPLNFESRNNLWIGGSLTVTRNTHASAVYNLTDNLFDTMTLTVTATGIGKSNNGYYSTTAMSGGSADVTLASAPDYVVGPLGSYYYPTTGTVLNSLRNAGSQANASSIGFYHYTTTADQTKETSTQLDIGLHSIATASSSSTSPKDTDGDGFADYLEDFTGEGSVSSGETDWNTPSGATDMGLQVRISRPRSGSGLP